MSVNAIAVFYLSGEEPTLWEFARQSGGTSYLLLTQRDTAECLPDNQFAPRRKYAFDISWRHGRHDALLDSYEMAAYELDDPVAAATMMSDAIRLGWVGAITPDLDIDAARSLIAHLCMVREGVHRAVVSDRSLAGIYGALQLPTPWVFDLGIQGMSALLATDEVTLDRFFALQHKVHRRWPSIGRWRDDN